MRTYTWYRHHVKITRKYKHVKENNYKINTITVNTKDNNAKNLTLIAERHVTLQNANMRVKTGGH